jgi:hypothetical protein
MLAMMATHVAPNTGAAIAIVSSTGKPAMWASAVPIAPQSAQLRPGAVLPFFGLYPLGMAMPEVPDPA